MPPYLVRDGFLEEEECDGLFHWALDRADGFGPSILVDRVVEPETRSSRSLPDARPLLPLFRRKLMPMLPDLFAALGVPPFDPPQFELQLTAHNDGDYYRPHIDTRRGPRDELGVRTISLVHYFSPSPLRFGGGALRIHAFGGSDSIDIDPRRNRLVAFPSHARHEVRPVTCTTRRFEDSRFAISCWLRKLPTAAEAQRHPGP